MLLDLGGVNLAGDLVQDVDSCPGDRRDSDYSQGGANDLLNVFLHGVFPFRGEWVSL